MITAGIEKFSDVIEAIRPLFPAHWEEVGIFKDRMPLAPRYEVYRAEEAAGGLVMPILRVDGKVAGYWPHFVGLGLHYGQTLTATMDILYVDPAHRGNGGAMMLGKCTAAELKRRGVQAWFAGSKNHKQIEGFLMMLGFEPVETRFARWIGDS
jgi:GNAT superfamily N-acetyltransferase